MTSQTVTAIKGRMMRLVKLDVCGNPVTGAGSSMDITKGFISIKPKPQYEDGVEFTQKLADGTLCVNQKDAGQLKRVQLEMLWCILDPDALVIMTGQRLLTTSATGTGVAFGEALANARFSLETWQDVTGRNACNANGLPQFVYWAFANISNTQVKDFSIENGALQFSVVAETTAAGPKWGTGVGWGTSWLPAPGTLNTDEHYAWNVTTNAPPVATQGAVALAG